MTNTHRCWFGLFLLLLASAVPSRAANQDGKAATKSVAGEWSLSIHGDHVMQTGLALSQEGTVVTGTMLMRGRSADAEGEFVEGKLTLTIDAAIAADHGAKAGTTKISVTATMKDDGTLEGEMRSGRGPIRITAERFRPKGAK